MYREQRRRSIVKAVAWRVLATVTTGLVVFLFTGRVRLAVAVGGVEALAKMALYFVHERLWDRIPFGKKPVTPCVLWFTGLSAAGKSTLADRVHRYLLDRGVNAERLDGDTVRSIFPNTGFSKEDRDSHVRRIGFLAATLERNGVFVVSSFISPYRDARAFVRGQCRRFVEIYVKASLATCERRDPKGLYRRARAGEIRNFTGVDDPYEEPQSPELTVDTDALSEEESFRQIRAYLERCLNG